MIATKRGVPAMQEPATIWDQIRIVGEAVISAGGAIGVIIGVWKLIPMMWDRSLLMARLQSAETAAREYRLACEEQKTSILMLEERNAELRAQNDTQEREALDFAVEAGSFIIKLSAALKRLTDKLTAAGITDVDPLPPVPEALEEAVAMAHRKQSEKRAQEVAGSGDLPFLNPPKENTR